MNDKKFQDETSGQPTDDGETVEFLENVEAHKKLIFKVANSYSHHAEDRKELIQEIVIQLWLSRHRYDDRFAMSTWVYRIALNVSITELRKSARYRRRFKNLDSAVEVISHSKERPFESEQIKQLYQFIGELKELDRALILLFLDQKSHKEMASILGLSVSNIGTRLSRIKDRLRKRFAKKSDFPVQSSKGKQHD